MEGHSQERESSSKGTEAGKLRDGTEDGQGVAGKGFMGKRMGRETRKEGSKGGGLKHKAKESELSR